MEKFEFQADTQRLLDLMIHSVYSNKDIFLRELISNASDALDKLRFEALTDKKLEPLFANPEIRIEPDPEKRIIAVHDNGVGMNKKELIDYVGAIAKSGAGEFLKVLKEKKSEPLSEELIGQFGVGIYSCFMVADKMTIVTRRAGEDDAWKWVSAGDGSYAIEEAEREHCGCSVILELKPSDDDGELDEYLKEWKIREIVKRYSDYVSYPIKMKVERKEVERDDEGKPKEGGEEKTVVEDVILNSMKAIWTRPEKDVSDEEYNEFYKHISHDWTDPMGRVFFKAEGVFNFRGLLFIPSRPPLDLFYPDSSHGVHLYVKRVFIKSDCKELIPSYLRFIRGVVDSEDLSLNISREILQQNRQIRVIRNKITSKVLEKLTEIKKSENEMYLKFWNEFGRVLKEGVFQDQKNREKILDLILAASTKSDSELITLEDYVSRMKDGQEDIYYITGKSREALEASPHLEAFRGKDYEVLLLTDAVDEVWAASVPEYKGKKLVSAVKGAVDLGSEEEKKEAEKEREKKREELKSLLEFLQEKLKDDVKEVRLSSRLTSSPACLVGETGDLTPQMEELLSSMGQKLPRTKRILELNPDHAVLKGLQKRFEQNREDPALSDYAELLYGQALLAEGSQPDDPARLSRLMSELMAREMA